MRFPYVVLLSACALMLALPLLAQSPNGVINGLVADPSNRVIVGADVVVVNDVTACSTPRKPTTKAFTYYRIYLQDPIGFRFPRWGSRRLSNLTSFSMFKMRCPLISRCRSVRYTRS